MTLTPGEVITVSFPFSDLGNSKQRPVVVISVQDRFGDFTCLAVTSRETRENVLIIDSGAMENGNLPKKSWIRYDKIFTLNSSLIKNQVDFLKKEKFLELMTNLCTYWGCGKKG